MPSTTFFNLPSEKREKLLRAAREEFTRVPYGDASINRIVRSAGIPRGSFYMYFQDKAELLHFLLGEYGKRLIALLEAFLQENHGDLFAAFLAFYDRILQETDGPGPDGGFVTMLAILRRNAGLHAHIFQNAAGPEGFLRHLTPHIDRSRLSLASETDLRDMLAILLGVTGPALCSGLQAPDPGAARARYVNILNILRRGMAAPVATR